MFERTQAKSLEEIHPFEKDVVYDMRAELCPDFDAGTLFSILNEMRTKAQLPAVSLESFRDAYGRKGIQVEKDLTFPGLGGVPTDTNLILMNPNEIQKSDVPPIMVLIHETLHIFSREFNVPAALNEALTQYLTVQVTMEYIKRKGISPSDVPNLGRIHDIYKNNMSVLGRLSELIAAETGVPAVNVLDGFIAEYFKGNADVHLRDITMHLSPAKRELMERFMLADMDDLFDEEFAKKLEAKMTSLSVPDEDKGVYQRMYEGVLNIRATLKERYRERRDMPRRLRK